MPDLDVSVVLPVYNEKGHLRTEVDRIATAFEASAYSWEIIVVDDGTDVVRQYLHLFPRRMSHVTTVTMAFLANGYSVKYVPVDYAERAGTSKFHWWHDTQRYILQVIRMMMSFNPLRIFLPIGMTLGLVGVAKLAYDWSARDFHLAANTLLVLFAAFQVLAIGLLADLVVRVTTPEHEV